KELLAKLDCCSHMLKQPAQVVFTSHRRLTSPSSVAPLTSLAGRPERPVDLRQHATARAIATVTSGTARQRSSGCRSSGCSTRANELTASPPYTELRKRCDPKSRSGLPTR